MTAVPRSPLSILMVASEAVPYAKTGGLGDVTSGLAKALGRLGHDVTLVLPKYRGVKVMPESRIRRHLSVGGRWFEVGYVEHRLSPDARVVLIECDELYDRAGLYADGEHAHPDNATRFAVLARAALEYPAVAARRPDVIHAHDWQAGLVPVYARTRYATHPLIRSAVTIFTIHNIAYQGTFPDGVLQALDLDRSLFTVEGLEFWGGVSFLKGGINFSDGVTTVSEGYAREVVTREYGNGLEGVVANKGDRFRGILNGIDIETWSPETDASLEEPFSTTDLSGKRSAKRRLLEQFGLPVSDQSLARPVVGVISRLVYQKGFDLVGEVLDELPETGASFVVLGTGERRFEEMWQNAAKRHPSVFGVKIGYDETLAHLVEAGADIFLMPSRYEPCGLNQMYSMRYGTVPVVHAVGGLDDAVTVHDAPDGRGTGFKFSEFTGAAMLTALRQAIRLFADGPRWRTLQVEGMSRDFSWTVPAGAYVREYRARIAQRDDGGHRKSDA